MTKHEAREIPTFSSSPLVAARADKTNSEALCESLDQDR